VECVCCLDVCSVNAFVLIYCYCLPVIDSNENECTEEGEVFDYQEEDQDKLSKASHLNLLHL
jgi:hypothetical protein